MSYRLSIIALAVGTAAVAYLPVSARAEDIPKNTIVEAVPALPTGFAYDDKPAGYENIEYADAVAGKLLRNPYVKSPAGGLDQDLTKFEPMLAESWDVSPDGLVYTFHLKKGALSQAGNELTAEDVIWSYERKWKTHSVAPFVNAPVIADPTKQFAKVDKYTFTITLARKGDGFTLLGLLANVTGEIYDTTLLKQHETKDDPYAVTWSSQNGNFGFGPYILSRFTSGQELVLRANPNYVYGKPKIERIIQRLVPDAGTRANLLRNGDVDVAVQLRPADISDLASDKTVSTFSMPTNNYVWLVTKTDAKPFSDLAVRQALDLAIPYDRIVEQVYKTHARTITSLINPVYPGASTDLPPKVYDPAKAKAILEQAGYKEPVKISIGVSTAVADLGEVALQIQTYAAKAGFDVQVNSLPAAALQKNISDGTFQSYLVRDMAFTQSPPYELLVNLGKGSRINRSKWENDDYYAAVKAGVDAGDPLSSEAAKHWNDAQKLWRQFVPYVTVAAVDPLMATRTTVKGFAHRSDNVIDFSILSKD
jgi:peptide/nickel transport system substrate-binding protein